MQAHRAQPHGGAVITPSIERQILRANREHTMRLHEMRDHFDIHTESIRSLLRRRKVEYWLKDIELTESKIELALRCYNAGVPSHWTGILIGRASKTIRTFWERNDLEPKFGRGKLPKDHPVHRLTLHELIRTSATAQKE